MGTGPPPSTPPPSTPPPSNPPTSTPSSSQQNLFSGAGSPPPSSTPASTPPPSGSTPTPVRSVFAIHTTATSVWSSRLSRLCHGKDCSPDACWNNIGLVFLCSLEHCVCSSCGKQLRQNDPNLPRSFTCCITASVLSSLIDYLVKLSSRAYVAVSILSLLGEAERYLEISEKCVTK